MKDIGRRNIKEGNGMRFEELELVNYCAPGCIPMLNIMRLSRDEAFELARRLADEHPETTAFYRFADFKNYYKLRENQDAYLHARFLELGGKPETEHPLSFVLEGSSYLKEWFGNGLETNSLRKQIYISLRLRSIKKITTTEA